MKSENNTILIGGHIYNADESATPLKVNQEIFNWIHNDQVHFSIEKQTTCNAYILRWNRQFGDWYNQDDNTVHQFDVDLLMGMNDIFNSGEPVNLEEESPYARFHVNTLTGDIYMQDLIVEQQYKKLTKTIGTDLQNIAIFNHDSNELAAIVW